MTMTMEKKLKIEFAQNGVIISYVDPVNMPTVHENRGGSNTDACRAIGEFIFYDIKTDSGIFNGANAYDVEVTIKPVSEG